MCCQSNNRYSCYMLYVYFIYSSAARDREDAIPVPDFQSHVEHMHVGKNFETEYNVSNQAT